MSSNSRPTTFAASGEPVRDNASLPRGREGAAASVGTDALNLSTENAPSFRAAEAAPQAAQLRLGERIADFELLRLLGEGSFGQVFLARQLSLGRDVALKITRNRGNEAQTLASLEHDHIVQVFTEVIDAGRGLRLLCMQYVPGTTLAQVMHRLRQRQRREWSGAALLQAIDELTPHPAPFHPAALRDREFLAAADLCQAVCWLGGRLAEALDHAHSRHVLHRDIKPANILLNHYGRPFLADFNLSFSADPIGGAGAAVFGGTLAYMARVTAKRSCARPPRRFCAVWRMPSGTSAAAARRHGASVTLLAWPAIGPSLPARDRPGPTVERLRQLREEHFRVYRSAEACGLSADRPR
jgi:Protein tyrosine and serine/threonine kinase